MLTAVSRSKSGVEIGRFPGAIDRIPQKRTVNLPPQEQKKPARLPGGIDLLPFEAPSDALTFPIPAAVNGNGLKRGTNRTERSQNSTCRAETGLSRLPSKASPAG